MEAVGVLDMSEDELLAASAIDELILVHYPIPVTPWQIPLRQTPATTTSNYFIRATSLATIKRAQRDLA